MTVYEWLLIGVLVLVPVLLVVSKRMRRRHWALLLIVWLAAVVAWLALTEHAIFDCLLHGSLCS